MIDEEQGLLSEVNGDIAKFTTKHEKAVADGNADLAGTLRDKLDLLDARRQITRMSLASTPTMPTRFFA